MEKISLYIAGKKVDLDNNSFILFNYTMEDLSNPTIVKNSFTKQITLKGTPANNEIFGNLWKADRKTIFGEGYTGVAFDPLRKTPFTIYNEMNEIIESGYVKVNSVSKISGSYEYKISLYGGLGSFFYSLTYDENGDKRTLADLIYADYNGDQISGKDCGYVENDGLTCVKEAWMYLENPDNYNGRTTWVNIINFSPCYNGTDSGFSYDKMLFADSTNKRWVNIYANDKHPDATSVLVTFENKHSEWEMKDLRWYLQRPVISMKAILHAITEKINNGGYSVILNNLTEKEYANVWITLPRIPLDSRKEKDAISKLLDGTDSPSSYLLSFAKTFGLVFVCDNYTKKITIFQRKDFYSGNLIDLESRVDASSIEITPMLVDAKKYQFGKEPKGAYAAEYKERYNTSYGIKVVDTGYEFNTEKKELTSEIIYENIAELSKRSNLFTSDIYYDRSGNQEFLSYFKLPKYEKVVSQEWRMVDGKLTQFESKAYQPPANYIYEYPVNAENPLFDIFPKAQFEDADDKNIDAVSMLLFDRIYTIEDLPEIQTDQYYYLTDDHPDMDLLNDGKPCWNHTEEYSIKIKKIPSFRRNLVQNKVVRMSLDFGIPREFAFVDADHYSDDSTIYDRCWRTYLSDRYDVDTRLMKCKVNLSGMQVGQGLMRNFFFYENAIWVLNKISNHSITTDDLTECEFIKVKDMKNYTQGQKL